jgi:hypothetical protein
MAVIQIIETSHAEEVEDVYIDDAGATRGLTFDVPAALAPRWRWWAAHRAARLACRGARRGDPRQITGAVAHAVGAGSGQLGALGTDDPRLARLIQAAVQAVGGPYLTPESRVAVFLRPKLDAGPLQRAA